MKEVLQELKGTSFSFIWKLSRHSPWQLSTGTVHSICEYAEGVRLCYMKVLGLKDPQGLGFNLQTTDTILPFPKEQNKAENFEGIEFEILEIKYSRTFVLKPTGEKKHYVLLYGTKEWLLEEAKKRNIKLVNH